MSYERDEAMRVQEATEEMIRMRTPLPPRRAPEPIDELLAAQARIVELEAAAREFLSAAEAVFDWMNGIDLSADHHDQKPDDYERVNAALPRLRAALSDRAP